MAGLGSSASRLSKRPRTNTVLLRGDTNPEWKQFLSMDHDVQTPASTSRSLSTSYTSALRPRITLNSVMGAARGGGGDDASSNPVVIELNVKVASLEAQLDSKTSELKELKTTSLEKEAEIIRLTSTICSLQLELDKEKAERSHDMEERTREIESESETVAELERKISFHSRAEDLLKDQIKELENRFNSSKTKAIDKIKQLETDKHQLRGELVDLREKQNAQNVQLMKSESMIRQGTETQSAELEVALSEASYYKERAQSADELNLQLSECHAIIEQQKESIEQFKSSQLESRENQSSSVGSAEAARRIRALERENSQIKASLENTYLLKQQLNAANDKAVRFENKLQEFIHLQYEITELRMLKSEWEELKAAGGEVTLESPKQLCQVLDDLRTKLAIAIEQKSSIETDLKVAVSASLQAEGKLVEEQRRAATAEAKNDSLAKTLQSRESKLVFLANERDSIREVAKSYADAPKVARGTQPDLSEQHLKEIRHLEKMLASANERIVALEAQAQAGSENRQGAKQQAENVADCDGEFPLGYDPRKTKVLSLINNPIRSTLLARAEELEKLRGECAAMRLQLEAKGVLGDASAGGSVPADIAKELETLRQEVQRANTKNERLKQVYTKMVQDFRDSCYALFGYEINLFNGTQYRLNSMYAESQDDSLLFQSSPEGMQMLHTDFATEMQDHAKTYLGRMNSIPAFLSTVTLDLFNRSTMMH